MNLFKMNTFYCGGACENQCIMNTIDYYLHLSKFEWNIFH